MNIKNFRWPFFRYPSITPTETELKRWACSGWLEYQAWLFHHGFVTLHDWQRLRQQVLTWPQRPLISIVTPVFNTPLHYLRECIYSVQTQIYPEWEFCLVNDGSDHPDLRDYLTNLGKVDRRFRIHHFSENQGICRASNQAIRMARGDYVVFLDHDDRLAPDALYHLAQQIFHQPDIVYSDRDMLSEEGLRFMHLFKPDWSPETLLSGNYLFHLVAYRRELLNRLGGVRVGLEGSQDYDLILRAADTHPKVQHIPKVLYHWRQHRQSVSLEHNSKEYAYSAGLRALQETLQRRKLVGQVRENPELWRGHYRIQLQPPPVNSYHLLFLETLHHYAQQINQAFLAAPNVDSLIILGPGVQPVNQTAFSELTSWLQIHDVGLVTGKVLDTQNKLLHTGLVQRPQGIPLAVYAGFPETTAGYMAVTAIVRNLSTPHPACCVVKRHLWQSLNGLNPDYLGPHAMLDFALRALTLGQRTVYTPFAGFLAPAWPTPETWPAIDRQRFVTQWSTWLTQGDPYYNPHLTLELPDMGLNTRWPLYCHENQSL